MLDVECFSSACCVFAILPASNLARPPTTTRSSTNGLRCRPICKAGPPISRRRGTLKVLNQPLVSTGKVWVTPGEFRWELGQPVQTIVLRQPDQLLIIYPRLKRAEKYPLDAVPTGPMKDALALLDASLPRDRATMEKNFRLLSATETNSILQMTLQPRSDSARKFIGEIVIGFHTNDFTIAATEMKFADGSSLRNDFTNVVLNQPIDPTGSRRNCRRITPWLNR